MVFADRVESLWEEALAVEVKELREDLPALDRVLADQALIGLVLERFWAGVVGDGAACAGRGAVSDRDRDVRVVDGAQGALPVGVSDVGGGGVGLDHTTAVLRDLAVRAPARRVDAQLGA